MSNPFTKEITAVFAQVGKRRKLVGFDAKLDGIYLGRRDSRDDAQALADEVALNWLTDGMHRTATQLDGAQAA